MTFLEAAAKVLEESSEPLTVREIVERVLADGLVVTKGKTPEAILRQADLPVTAVPWWGGRTLRFEYS